ncbi:uncharacterized protein LOC101847366, partial [Aplysia californica]|uniref:Uncharacterized protein LOC101847366 n=1 Tax=Aplysia californica TaxID=6500 RepID=A0ABM0K2G9_APLCA
MEAAKLPFNSKKIVKDAIKRSCWYCFLVAAYIWMGSSVFHVLGAKNGKNAVFVLYNEIDRVVTTLQEDLESEMRLGFPSHTILERIEEIVESQTDRLYSILVSQGSFQFDLAKNDTEQLIKQYGCNYWKASFYMGTLVTTTGIHDIFPLGMNQVVSTMICMTFSQLLFLVMVTSAGFALSGALTLILNRASIKQDSRKHTLENLWLKERYCLQRQHGNRPHGAQQNHHQISSNIWNTLSRTFAVKDKNMSFRPTRLGREP